MKIFTSRPIIEDKSNCCGGMSGMNGFSNAIGDNIAEMVINSAQTMEDNTLKLPPKSLQQIPTDYGTNLATPIAPTPPPKSQSNREMFGDYLSGQKTARKDSRGKAVSDVLSGSEGRRDTRRGGRDVSRASRLESKDSRVSERIANRQARAKRRTDRKAKRNAKKLILVKTPKSTEPKFFFPLQKLRLSKKKKGKYEKVYPDGTTSEVDKSMVVTDPQTGAVYDKKEISNATGIPTPKVTPETLTQKDTTPVTDPTTKEPTKAIEVNDNIVSGAEDGSAYLNSDIQGSQEPPQNVAEDDKKKEEGEKGWSTTTKIVVGVSALAVVGLIIYAVVKSRSGSVAPKI